MGSVSGADRNILNQVVGPMDQNLLTSLQLAELLMVLTDPRLPDNPKRHHSKLGYLSPVAFERAMA